MALTIFRKVLDGVVSTLGYMPIQKGASDPSKFKAISMAPNKFGSQNMGNIKAAGIRKPSKVSFRQLRQIAQYDSLIRICVNVIKKSVSQCDWEIQVKDNAPKKAEQYEKQKQQCYDLFEFMNSNGENMRVMLDRIMEDILVLDAGAIEIVRTLDGKSIAQLNSVDAASIRPIYNEYGEIGDPAYLQMVNDKKVAEFGKKELVYIMANPQNDMEMFGYGMSPIESILLQVQASLEADMYNIKHFTKDNMPPGMLDLGDMTNEQAQEFIALWNATVLGNTHGMKFIWGSSNEKKFIPLNTSNKDMQYTQYIDWLSRVKLATYGLTSMDANITGDVNKATATVQKQLSEARGVRSYKKLMEEYITRCIIREMGEDFKRLEFKFQESDTLDGKQVQANIDKVYIDSGVMTPNEIREREGLGQLEEPVYDENVDAGILSAITTGVKPPVKPTPNGKTANKKPAAVQTPEAKKPEAIKPTARISQQAKTEVQGKTTKTFSKSLY